MDVDGDFDIVAKALVEDMWLTIADSHRKKKNYCREYLGQRFLKLPENFSLHGYQIKILPQSARNFKSALESCSRTPPKICQNQIHFSSS
jgi:hypothetical protein